MHKFGRYSLWFAKQFIETRDQARWVAAYLPLNARVEMIVRGGATMEDVAKLQRMWDIHRCQTLRPTGKREPITYIEVDDDVYRSLK